MPDEQTTPEQGGTKSEEAPTTDSSNEASTSRGKPSSGRSLGWWAVCSVLIILVLIIGGYGYLLYVNLNPGGDPDGFRVRRVASTASNYLSSDPSVASAEAAGAKADIDGSSVTVDAHLKDDTSAGATANLLASTRQETLQQEPDYSSDFATSMSRTVNGSIIDTDVQCQRDSETVRTDVRRTLTPVRGTKTFTDSINTYTKLTIDYGQATALPTSLTQPSVPNPSRTFTMSDWKVISTSKTDGQFSNPPFNQIITATRQASLTGTINLDGTTLSITGLVTDENKGFTPEAAAPVVYAVAGCQAAGLTTLEFNGKPQKGFSNDDPWITFVCNNGTWVSKYDSPSSNGTEILNRAAELWPTHRPFFASAASGQTPPPPRWIRENTSNESARGRPTPDKQTTPERRGAQSEEIPATGPSNEASAGRRKPLSGRSAGWWAIRAMLVVLVLIVGSFVYLIDITLHPDSDPEGFKVRHTASAAEKHLSRDPNVVSVTVISASADIGGTEADPDVRLKDDTNADAVADLLASTHIAAFGRNSPDTNINPYVTLSWALYGTNIKTIYDCAGRPDLLHTARQNLTTADEAKTIDITGSRLNIDYGQVTAIPAIFLQPSTPHSTKTSTINGWKVTSTSDADGQLSNPPFDQFITTAGQTGPTGTIDLDGGTLSVTGLVADDTRGLTPEATAPVVHTVVDCQSAGLTTLQLNNWAADTNSVTGPWLIFTCGNGIWTPQHDGSTGQDEATVLNEAAEF